MIQSIAFFVTTIFAGSSSLVGAFVVFMGFVYVKQGNWVRTTAVESYPIT